MWWRNSLNLHDLISPICQIWKYTGLPIIEYESKQKYEFVYKHSRWSFFVIIAICVSVYVLAYLNVFSWDGHLTDIIASNMYLCMATQSIWVILIIRWKRYDIQKLINEFKRLENSVYNLTNARLNYKTIVKKTLIFLISKYVILVVLIIFDRPPDITLTIGIASNLAYYSISLIDFHVHALEFVLCRILLGLYKLQLENLQNSRTLTNHQLLSIYSQLKENSKNMGRVFQGFILGKCFGDVTSAACALYFFVEVINRTNSINYDIVFSTLMTVQVLFYDFLLFNDFTAFLEHDAKMVKRIIKILDNPNRRASDYKATELFQLNIRLNRLKFSVCATIPLDRSLFYAIIAAVTTQTIYLLQFRQMRKSDPTDTE